MTIPAGTPTRAAEARLYWAHARSHFFELADAETQLKERRKGSPVIAPLAFEAARRINAEFVLERTIAGQSAEQRRIDRKQHVTPLLAHLWSWMAEQRSSLSPSFAVAKAMDYMLKDWRFRRFSK